MRDHLKVLGWLYVANGILALLPVVALVSIFGAAGALADRGVLMGGIGFMITAFIAVLAIPSLICGWALLNYKPWARTLGIVLSVLNLPSFPVGTLVGGYGLWVLLNDESKRMLEAGDPRYRQVGAGW